MRGNVWKIGKKARYTLIFFGRWKFVLDEGFSVGTGKMKRLPYLFWSLVHTGMVATEKRCLAANSVHEDILRMG